MEPQSQPQTATDRLFGLLDRGLGVFARIREQEIVEDLLSANARQQLALQSPQVPHNFRAPQNPVTTFATTHSQTLVVAALGLGAVAVAVALAR